MLAVAGKFPPADYTDGRFSTDAPSGAQNSYSSISSSLGANLGRMPILQVGTQSVGQSAAINFYIAQRHGLMGSSILEGAQIFAVQEHLKELKLAYYKLIPYSTTPTDELLVQWFEQGAVDRGTKPAARGGKRQLQWFMGRIEDTLQSPKFAVGNKISLADILIYNVFAETLSEDCAPKGLPAYKREPFGSKVRMDKALVAFPKLQGICAAVASHPGIMKWLQMRGVQGF